MIYLDNRVVVALLTSERAQGPQPPRGPPRLGFGASLPRNPLIQQRLAESPRPPAPLDQASRHPRLRPPGPARPPGTSSNAACFLQGAGVELCARLLANAFRQGKANRAAFKKDPGSPALRAG